MKKKYGAEQIIGAFMQCEVWLSQGKNIAEVCRELGISDATYYKWRKALWRDEGRSGKAVKGAREGKSTGEAGYC